MSRRRKARAGDVVYIDPYVQPPGFGYGGAHVGGMTPWQQFVHEHAHMGYSPSQLGQMYDMQMAGLGYGQTVWNKFVKENAHKGYSPTQLGQMYEKSKASGSRKASRGKKRRGRGGAMVAGFDDWHKFLHEYGGRGMTRSELVELYHRLHPK